MNTNLQANNSPHLLMWIAGIAVILFSAAGIAAIMGWIPTSMGQGAARTDPVYSERPSTGAVKPGSTGTSTSPASHNSPLRTAENAPAQNACAGCGVIESTHTVSKKGEGSGIGAVGGAVVGGLLGNQVGSGRGNTVATAIGAVGGAVAGNEVEKRVKTNKSYEVTVRLDDGSSRVINAASPTAWHTGDHVKIVGNEIQANP